MAILHLKSEPLRGINIVGHRNTASKQWNEALAFDYPTTTFKREGIAAESNITVQPKDILSIIEFSADA